MAPERLTHGHGGARALRRPALSLSPGAALALVAGAASAWLVTAQPAGALGSWARGASPAGGQETMAIVSAVYGSFALAAALFAVAVYVVYWPVVASRETSRDLVRLRAELQAVRLEKDQLSETVARLRVLRAEMAMLRAELCAFEEATRHPGPRGRSGRAIVDDIISELAGV